jgi:hypothetical protein
MKSFRLIGMALLASNLVLSAATSDPTAIGEGGSSGGTTSAVKLTATLPPVLRPLEPADSRRLMLPGPPRSARPAATAPRFKTLPPVAKMSKLPTRLVEDPILRQPLPRLASTAPPIPVKPAMPTELEREVAVYCQKQIGHWKESDARAMLGHPKRQRPAYDEKRSVNGVIYAFADPTGRYQDLELDFDRESGNLRTVFVYPPKLTWQECRRLWAGPFTSADAKQGRMFYSYTNRRLDVLVDAGGKVVSLGWY